MKQPPTTIRRCSSGDIQKSILIDLIRQQRLSLPVFWVILDYAQTVDPQVPNVEFPSHNNGISEGFWNSRQFEQKLLFSCLSERSNRSGTPAVTESSIRSFKNYGIGLNELNIIVAAIVGTNIQESRRISGCRREAWCLEQLSSHLAIQAQAALELVSGPASTVGSYWGKSYSTKLITVHQHDT